LQLVETKGDAKPAKVAAEPAKPKAPRKAPNWKKDATAAPADAPLVMVETKN
jgi:ribonuclease E